ncbi:uncharacterized protein (DUF1778 family) [Methanococcus voltae PS]|uniref:Uncharacterized protein (DUF1778 family) n=1 Tax=Methanococcus voltae PS TaxID=523842 RepID=A0ABT2EVY1_METVO|nr:hypothetical protein [Methanococcus voltae]MCS3922005.1 uncharacterized protein (DUF1778 family) [Methanococcus voltae PS]
MVNTWNGQIKPGRPPKHKHATRFEVRCDLKDRKLLEKYSSIYKVSMSEFVVRSIKSKVANQYFDNEKNQKIIKYLKRAVISMVDKLNDIKQRLEEKEQELNTLSDENDLNVEKVIVLQRYIKLQRYSTSEEFNNFINNNKELLVNLDVLSSKEHSMLVNLENNKIKEAQEEHNKWIVIYSKWVNESIVQLEELNEKEKTEGLSEQENILKKIQVDIIATYGTSEQIKKYVC